MNGEDAQNGAAPGNDSDMMLVERTVAGDKRAFDLLVIKYQRRVERLISRLVRDPQLVEDIAQETFISAYRALAQFRGESQFYTWLYRIAVNTANKMLRRHKREPLVLESELQGGDDDETFSPSIALTTGETPETLMAAGEIAAAINRAMEEMPEDLRQAIMLREMEGLSYEEIAEMVACPVGTVRSRLFRAREYISARLRPMLEAQTGKRW